MTWSLKLLAAAGIGAVLSFTGPASAAGLHICEPDAFAAGTNMTNACSGVTLTVAGGFPGPVSAGIPGGGFASTGTLGFVHPTFPTWSSTNNNILRADFSVPIELVSLDLIGDDSLDLGFLRAFDAADVMIGEVLTPNLGTGQIFTATINVKGIAYILASGRNGEALNLDNLRFNVPEPATLALFGLGIGALGLARRRKTA
jgi:hypothetical protein